MRNFRIGCIRKCFKRFIRREIRLWIYCWGVLMELRVMQLVLIITIITNNTRVKEHTVINMSMLPIIIKDTPAIKVALQQVTIIHHNIRNQDQVAHFFLTSKVNFVFSTKIITMTIFRISIQNNLKNRTKVRLIVKVLKSKAVRVRDQITR